MERIIIEDIADVAQIMYDKILSGCESICFVGNYEDVSQLLKELLMSYDETSVHQIMIENTEWDGYDKEYLVTLDNEMNIWCEKAYQEEYERYFIVGDECVLIADDCNSNILDKIESDEVYEVSYEADDEFECDGDCERCLYGTELNDVKREELETESKIEHYNISKTKDGKVAGFSTSWSNVKDGETSYSSFSYYGDNEATVIRLAKEFGIDI